MYLLLIPYAVVKGCVNGDFRNNKHSETKLQLQQTSTIRLTGKIVLHRVRKNTYPLRSIICTIKAYRYLNIQTGSLLLHLASVSMVIIVE